MYEKKQMKNLILIRFEIEVLRTKIDHVERNTIIRLSSGKGNPSVNENLVTILYYINFILCYTIIFYTILYYINKVKQINDQQK